MSKKVQKSDKNICTVIFLPLSLHPQSGNNTGCDGSEKGYQQLIKQNVENFSKKSFKKIWWLQKFALPLQPLSTPNEGGSFENGSLIYWLQN